MITNNNYEKDENFRNLTENIINIGNGIYENHRNDKEFREFKNKEGIENRRNWIVMSDNIEDIAKFSPYIKDNYKRMTALEIYRTFKTRLQSEDLSTYSDEDFTNYIEQIKTEMIQEFSDTGIEPRHYSEFIEQFNQDCTDAMKSHVNEYSLFIYQNVLEKHGEDLAFNLQNDIYEYVNQIQDIPDTQDYITVIAFRIRQLRDIVTYNCYDKVAECLELGIPKGDIANIILLSILQLVKANGKIIDESIIISALENLVIGNTKFSEIVIDFSNVIKDIVNSAFDIYIDAQNKQKDTEQYTYIQNKELALEEFLNWYNINKNSYPQDIENIINNLMQKYNISDDSFLNTILKTKTILKLNASENPLILSYLERKSITDNLTTEDIEHALINNFICINDAIRLIKNKQKPVKAEVTAFEMSDYNSDLFNIKNNPDIALKRNLITIELNEGKIKLSEAEKLRDELLKEFNKQ